MAGLNRAVRVVAICLDRLPGADAKEWLDFTIERMDFASTCGPDIVCTPECFLKTPETPPGPITERLGEWGRAHHCYVIASIYTLQEGRKYNSAVLLDRQGRVVGQYNKIHPTEGEIKDGITPGDEDPPVFKTDFGTIGIQICFDVNWRDTWSRLKHKGAEIVFWPSAFAASRHLSALAWLNQFYVASATRGPPSNIYDISGDLLDRSGARTQWTDAVLHLSKRLFEIDYHIEKARRIEKKYGTRVRIVWQHEDDWFTLASLDPDLAVEHIIKEFELTPLTEYLAHNKTVQDQHRPGVRRSSLTSSSG